MRVGNEYAPRQGIHLDARDAVDRAYRGGDLPPRRSTHHIVRAPAHAAADAVSKIKLHSSFALCLFRLIEWFCVETNGIFI